MPSAIAAEQVTRELTLRRGATHESRVWTWRDLWSAVRSALPAGPVVLSAAAARALVAHALDRSPVPDAIAAVAALPGYRRALARRFAAWTRAEADAGDDPKFATDVEQAEWRVYQTYQRLLTNLGAIDASGLGSWAARALENDRPPGFEFAGAGVFILEPTALDAAMRSAISHFARSVATVRATLPWTSGPHEQTPYAAIAPVREFFLRFGFTESPLAPAASANGLASLSRAIFDGAPRLPLDHTSGIELLGAPRGDGLAAVVARQVKRLTASGCSAERIAIAVPQWDEQAELIRQTLLRWKLPLNRASTPGLARDPEVATLLESLAAPISGWDSTAVIRLLRNSLFQPDSHLARAAFAFAEAAAAIRDVRVSRGRESIRQALADAANAARGASGDDGRRRRRLSERAGRAVAVLELLDSLLGGVDEPKTWKRHGDRARSLASAIGLRASEPLNALFDAIDDRSALLEQLRAGDEIIPADAFLAELRLLAKDSDATSTSPRRAGVRLATVDELRGTQFSHVIAAGLGEGTMPNREALIEGKRTRGDDGYRFALAREMERFLTLVGSAAESLTLVYPTSDERGQPLLCAGFVDEVKLLHPQFASESPDRVIKRIDAVAAADLAGEPREARVRAVHLALRGEMDELDELLRRAEHFEPLQGVAAALELTHARLNDPRLGDFDGLIADADALKRVSQGFSTSGGEAVFSASQLETLAFCPFKFAMQYVLRVEAVDERDPFDGDATSLGVLVHAALEHAFQREIEAPGDERWTKLEPLAAEIENAMREALDARGGPRSDFEAGLRAIESDRLFRMSEMIARQVLDYRTKHGEDPHPIQVEAEFGVGASMLPPLRIGDGDDAVLLRGKIDRVDEFTRDGRRGVRVIDYKTGRVPGQGEAEKERTFQLPIYGLVAAQLRSKDGGPDLLDLAYWDVRGKGYKPVLQSADVATHEPSDGEWEQEVSRIEARIKSLASQTRRGEFPVLPQVDDCTRYCEYNTVCRIAQVRRARKAPLSGPEVSPT